MLTGIKREVVKKLRSALEVTVEVYSQHNVNRAAWMRKGEHVFVTDEAEEDAGKGTEGAVCEVLDVHVGFVRKEIPGGDEVEVVRGRLRLRFLEDAVVDRVLPERDVVVKPITHAYAG